MRTRRPTNATATESRSLIDKRCRVVAGRASVASDVLGHEWRTERVTRTLRSVRWAVLAAFGATRSSCATAAFALGLALSWVAGCSILAGYEDLRFVPGQTDTGDGATLPVLDLTSATIYSVYPEIFSAEGNLAGVTAQLQRIHDLGFNVLSLMPVTPVGAATGNHPTVNSPYCVHDYESINPAYGSAADLIALVQAAHQLGMYVMLDEEINQTSWDNALIGTHPEYYVHDDAGAIENAFMLPDVAQLDYQSPALQTYITAMLETWLRTYDVDGFRFITADVPPGSPLIPATFWRSLRVSLQNVKPQVVLWADEEDPSLADAPFELDYGWLLRGGEPGGTGAGLQQVATGASATELAQAWQQQESAAYAGVLHTNLLQTWDLDEDLKIYGGAGGTMVAATFNFMIDGVPMLWNGEEVGNEVGGPDTHSLIAWDGPNAAPFTAFYKALLVLRNANSALRAGTLSWVTSSAPEQVASFVRSDASGAFLVVINFSNGQIDGTVAAPSASGWTDISPAGSPGGTTHAAPPSLSLKAYDFAVLRAN